MTTCNRRTPKNPCCRIVARLYHGALADIGYPTSFTNCIFSVIFELWGCGLEDSNQSGVITSPFAPSTTAVLTGNNLGELYNGPATDIPVWWPARNGETYTLTITDTSDVPTCQTKTATLTIPSGTCCAGGLEWLLDISGGVNYSHTQTFTGLFAGTTTASIDSTGLNSSIAKELFIHEFNPGPGNTYRIALDGEHVYIGDVTSSVSTTRIGGGTLTSTSTFAFYWQFGVRTSSPTTWPPSFINTPEFPEARLVARCTAKSIASNFYLGATRYVQPFSLFDWGITTSDPNSTPPFSDAYVHFNLGRVFAGNLKTPLSSPTRYELSLCELIDTGYSSADFGCFKNPSGLNAPFIPVNTDGSNLPDSDGFLIKSIYNIP